MKRKLIAGVLAFVPIALVVVIALGTGTAYEGSSSANYSSSNIASAAAPQNRFGIWEAQGPSYDRVEKHAPPIMASIEAKDATATDAGSAGREGIPPTAIAPGLPKIAYNYGYSYRIAAEEISGLQRRHADQCEVQGPRVCRILSLQQSGDEGDYARATLELAVAAPRARKFGAELAHSVEAAGGKEVSSSISGEDLSKAIVDTEARLRARTLLRDRLMEVLATRRGTVTELVEAERGVAQVNEEIDEARSWLNEMQGRVEFSRVTVEYSASAPSEGGFLAPIRSVFGSIGAIFGTAIAAIIGLLAIVGPFGLAGWLFWRLWRRFQPRFAPEPEAEPA